MPQLYLHNKSIESFFELLGRDENDITYSVGWVLYSSPSFLREFLKKTIQYESDVSEATIRLQGYRRTQGITDIEITKPREFHVIVEAKKGWSRPGITQLKRYARRLWNGANGRRKILALSEWGSEYAGEHLECQDLKGIPVEAISWKALAHLASRALSKGDHGEKRLLREMLRYLGRVVTMQDIESNKVFVVPLEGRGIINWTRKKVYFHPVRGAPKQRPNYVACRYDARLQFINHVDSYEVVDERELYKRRLIPRVPLKKRRPHFLYRLGPAIRPPNEIRSGRLWDRRVWCMLDTLLTCKTISEAEALSQKRSKMAERMGG